MEFVKHGDYKNMKSTLFDYDFSDPTDPDYNMNRIKSLALRSKVDDKDLKHAVSSFSNFFAQENPTLKSTYLEAKSKHYGIV